MGQTEVESPAHPLLYSGRNVDAIQMKTTGPTINTSCYFIEIYLLSIYVYYKYALLVLIFTCHIILFLHTVLSTRGVGKSECPKALQRQCN